MIPKNELCKNCGQWLGGPIACCNDPESPDGNEDQNSARNRGDHSNGDTKDVRWKASPDNPTPWCTRPKVP